jgi:hypothetical protein
VHLRASTDGITSSISSSFHIPILAILIAEVWDLGEESSGVGKVETRHKT